ncbi:MAG: HAD hydrolase family protein [Spirochaetaceae bacterium]|jgi:hypothetical protein|nr:HAD hydrolase family protein [Spirochaetaceae bacterium]
MKKIVFLDIDGTLMAMDQTIPLSAIEACRSARKNGHLLYICSGRQSIEIPRQVREIGFDGLVSAGGASIETAGRNIFQAFMDRGTVIRIVDFFSARREAFALDLPDQKISTPALWALMERAFRSIKGKEAKGKDARKGGGGRGNANDTSCRPLAPASTNPYGPIGFVPSSATPSAGDKTMRRMVLWAYPERPRTDAGLSTPRPGSPKQDAEGCREPPATPP